MDNFLFQSYNIEERSYVAFVKREIHNLVLLPFGANRTAEIDIVISEMCTNLINHVGSGELLYRFSIENKVGVLEVICIDNGKGMSDLKHSSIDGVSSKKTLGQGIGAIKRLSNFSQIYSLPNWGTIYYSRFYKSLEFIEPAEKEMVRCLNVAKPGEKVSGDGAAYRRVKNKLLLFTGDGLGHGINAKEASDKAINIFNESVNADSSELIREIDKGVKKTRGLVATVAILDLTLKQWEYCGVGNIYTRLQRGLDYKNYIAHNGVIGLNIPTRLVNSVAAMERFQLFIMCSDGITTRWDLMNYPAILKYDPMIIAAAIYKDHARKNDDMTVFITKII